MNAFSNPLFEELLRRERLAHGRMRRQYQEPQFHWWQGVSGLWYVHSVYALANWPEFNEQNYVFARKEANGLVSPIYIGQTADGRNRRHRHEKLIPAIILGATHVHVHLLARSHQARLNVETDLRNGHRTLLNEQGSALPQHRRLFGPY
jgi:hypothetical protein